MLRFLLTLVFCMCVILDKIECRTVKRDTNEEQGAPETNAEYCSQPLGITRDSINIQVGFTISSNDNPPRIKRSGMHTPWSPNTDAERSYIQVEFERPMFVSGMIAQGSPNTESRVTHFRVTYSVDCIHFHPLADKTGVHTEFVGNLYVNTTNTIMFDDILVSRCLRIVPTKTVGDDTAIRFELLGCDMSHCDTTLIPVDEGGAYDLKTFVFDKEKIISSIKINSDPGNAAGVPAFILATSRSCNFEHGDRLGNGNRTKIYTMDRDSSELIINDDHFPVRAQCFVIFSPDPQRIPSEGVDIDDVEGQLHRIDQNQYHVTFFGCDALEPHEALATCGQTRMSNHHHQRHQQLRQQQQDQVHQQQQEQVHQQHQEQVQQQQPHQQQQQSREKRVIGGSPSLPGEWPWLISLHFLISHEFTDSSGLPHMCGGSLIHPQWVLSAAHCFDDLVGDGLSNEENWIAVAGEHYQGNYDGTEQFIPIERIIKHPYFILAYGHEIVHDVALVKLSRPAHLTDYVNTVCIDANYTVPDYTVCRTSGWGIVDVDGVGVELPNSAELSIVPRQECLASYNSLPDDDELKQWVAINESVICASASQSGIDSCRGDSGGPLVCYEDGHWTQVGIVSLGYACGDIRYPGIYTNVSYFYDWIHDVITKNSD